jgi:hypothetical protein
MRLLLILVLLSHQGLLKGQILMSTYTSKMVNSNFIIEYHSLPDRNFKEFIYLVQFDTLIPRLEMHFANRRDLDYFNNYVLCFLSECHRDRQPLLFPGSRKILYDEERRAYVYEDSKSVLFSRKSFVQFAREIQNSTKRSRVRVSQGWQRLKVYFS